MSAPVDSSGLAVSLMAETLEELRAENERLRAELEAERERIAEMKGALAAEIADVRRANRYDDWWDGYLSGLKDVSDIFRKLAPEATEYAATTDSPGDAPEGE